MSRSKRDRAKKLFEKPRGSGTPESKEQDAERRAIAEKIARLRALRLARDEAAAEADKARKPSKTT